MIRIGTSGWSYEHWAMCCTRPAYRLPRDCSLPRGVDTVELNASSTGWPIRRHVRRMAKAAARRLHHVDQAHSRLTHFRRVGSPEPWVERFERCWTALGGRREALLVQLHPAIGT